MTMPKNWPWDVRNCGTLRVGKTMGLQRAHVVLPQELLQEIDSIVGPRGRSAFLVDTARAELRRRRLLKFLQNDEPVWEDLSHPELAQGAATWVKALRQEGEKRVPTDEGRAEVG